MKIKNKEVQKVYDNLKAFKLSLPSDLKKSIDFVVFCRNKNEVYKLVKVVKKEEIKVEEIKQGSLHRKVQITNKIGRINNKELVELYYHLEKSLANDIDMSEIDVISNFIINTNNFKLKKVLYCILYILDKGKSLSEAFSIFPKYFTSNVIYSVEAAEQTNEYERCFHEVRVSVEYIIDLFNKVIMAISYPTLIVVVVYSSLSYILLDVVPKFAEVLDQHDDFRNIITDTLLLSSGYVNKYPFLIGIIPGFIILLGIIRFFFSNSIFYEKYVGKIINFFLYYFPITNEFYLKYSIARLISTLNLLISNNIPIETALSISKDSCEHKTLKKGFGEIIKLTEKGQSLAYSFFMKQDYFGKDGIGLSATIKISEETGKYRESLSRYVEFIYKDFDKFTTRIKGLITAIAMTFGFIMVLCLFYGLMFPIYEATDNMNFK